MELLCQSTCKGEAIPVLEETNPQQLLWLWSCGTDTLAAGSEQGQMRDTGLPGLQHYWGFERSCKLEMQNAECRGQAWSVTLMEQLHPCTSVHQFQLVSDTSIMPLKYNEMEM